MILAGSALLGRVCETQCRPDLVTKYATIALGRIDGKIFCYKNSCLKKKSTIWHFSVSESYEEQLVHISALNNFGTSNLIELLGPIIRSNPDDFLRLQAALAVFKLAPTHPKEVSESDPNPGPLDPQSFFF